MEIQKHSQIIKSHEMVGMRMSVKYSIKVLYARTQSLQSELISRIDHDARSILFNQYGRTVALVAWIG